MARWVLELGHTSDHLRKRPPAPGCFSFFPCRCSDGWLGSGHATDRSYVARDVPKADQSPIWWIP